MIIATITSRWQSKRLPGKALKKIQGKPLIKHIVDSARLSTVDEVIVATTLSSPSIIRYCIENDIPYYAHSNDWDILSRLLAIVETYKADVLVYLWGDCPFIDPYMINKGLEYFNIKQSYFFDPTENFAIVSADKLREMSRLPLSKHKKEYIHDYMIRTCCPIVEVNTEEDLRKANEVLQEMRTARY
jgi:spore coat polysaccharide biosynthesis protein SpsF